jgi:photosystem II stability/assembly factor-like uncharacterized protein
MAPSGRAARPSNLPPENRLGLLSATRRSSPWITAAARADGRAPVTMVCVVACSAMSSRGDRAPRINEEGLTRADRRRGRRRLSALIVIPLALVAAIGLVGCGSSGSDGAELPSGGALSAVLADAHAHSLMVDREDPERLWLGVHGGLYVSDDTGRSWSLAALEGEDAMNLARGAGDAPFWVAGHNVLERSDDGGGSFEPVRPEGLPNLDLHGFAVRPGRPGEIMAAAAGEGLYRSLDAGQSYERASAQVGPSVFGMAFAPNGTLFAADPSRGLIISPDGGRTFRVAVEGTGLVSVAVVPRRPGFVLASGEPGVIVSTDGGDLWESAFKDVGVATVAIDPSDPRRAYAVGLDGRLYATGDAARTWSAVGDGA